MKVGKLALLFLLVVIQNIVCMDNFVRQALAFKESGELEQELLDAKFDMMMHKFEEYHRKITKQYLDEVVDTIEKGLYTKEKWQSGEIESLFSGLFSAKFPEETVEEAIERFEQS